MGKSEVGRRALSPSLRAKRSNPPLHSGIDGLLRRYAPLRKRLAFVAGNDGEGVGLLRPILIRRNLDQAAIRIPAIDRSQRSTGALFGDRAFLDSNPVGFQVRHDLVRRA